MLMAKHAKVSPVKFPGVGGAVRFLVVAKRKDQQRSALDGAVFDIAQILAYLVHNMSTVCKITGRTVAWGNL